MFISVRKMCTFEWFGQSASEDSNGHPTFWNIFFHKNAWFEEKRSSKTLRKRTNTSTKSTIKDVVRYSNETIRQYSFTPCRCILLALAYHVRKFCVTYLPFPKTRQEKFFHPFWRIENKQRLSPEHACPTLPHATTQPLIGLVITWKCIPGLPPSPLMSVSGITLSLPLLFGPHLLIDLPKTSIHQSVYWYWS